MFKRGTEPRNRPRRTHRVSGGIAQLFLNLSTRRGCVVSIMLRPPLPPGKSRYPLYCYVYVFLLLCMLCSVYSVFIVPSGLLRLP
jgi:hypothetical protein